MAMFNINNSSLNNYLNEDMSDIRSNIAQNQAIDRVRSEKGIPKRPKISKNMTNSEKGDLRIYDHGDRGELHSNVTALRNRRNYKQNVSNYHVSNAINNHDTKYYNDGNRFIGLGSKGVGTSKKKKLKEAAEYIISVLDKMEYTE